MKIAHVICSLCTGGAELMLIDILDKQADHGQDVTLIVVNKQYEQSLINKLPQHIRTIFIDRPEGSKNPFWLLKLNYVLRKLKPEIIHYHHDKAAGMSFRLFDGGKTIATVHDTKINLKYYLNLDEVCSISESVQQDLMSRYGIESPVVYNGIDTDLIKRKEFQQHHSKTQYSIVQVSRLNHGKKGQDLLIDAVAKLIDEGFDIGLSLIGVGESEQFLKERAVTLGIEHAVNFLGLRDRNYIYEHLQDYDLLVQPSRYEGFGLTVAEAMIAKVPVLVSDIEGPMEVIGNGLYGRSFRTGSVDSLVDSLRSIFRDYDSVRRIAEHEAYNHALSSFDISVTAKRYIDRYSRLLSTK